MAEIRLDLGEVDGDLPQLCMCCGGEATVTKTRKMSWCPPWVGALIFAGWLPYLIVAMILTKRAKVQVPLCNQHKGHWFNRNLLVCASLFFFLVIGAAGTAAAIFLDPRGDHIGPIACIGGLGMFVTWLIIVIAAQNTAIRPKEITDDEIVLQGVSNEFVDAYEEIDRERRARRKKRRQRPEYDDEEPAPRKKSPASDAIKSKERRRADEIKEDEPRPRKKRRPAEDDE